ncbi:P-loop containing nucleoside triphosphate hydrolase protein [Mycena galopus ATCC 62051]|nr:P-loop containing nucleoside triphosphate hydrolase protein [Mycena galopus ATCC 62051]
MSLTLPGFNSNHSDSSEDHESDHGVGLSDPLLSQGRRRMLDLVNRLHNTGVQIDIHLPQIAVMGIQSAGKSSLIESISGITLPRAVGTCTRCPTECRLSRSDAAWSCTVELRLITDKKGQPLGQARNEPFGDTILDKSAVEDRIRRAQRAILNPSKPPGSFLDDVEEDTTEISFSTNYISLQISGPEVADLSFVDLPGLIASVSRGGNERDIAMVENLVASYISKPSCVILLTVACESVLTKPDRIPRGDEENWLPLIRNEQKTLENNWYCVKQPSSQDIKQGVTWEEARARENDFFSLTSPWSELDPLYQKYLRTSNLIDRLSSILSDLISKRYVRSRENTVQKTRETLPQLPKPPSNDAVGEIASLLHGFVGELHKILEGIPRANGLLQVIRPAQEQFRRAIQGTAPAFRPFEEPQESLLSEPFPEPDFLLNEDGNTSDGGDSMRPPIFIEQALERALAPGHIPFLVQKGFINEFTAKWASPAMALCRFVHTALAQHVKALVSLHFSSFGQGSLEQRVIRPSYLERALPRGLQGKVLILLPKRAPEGAEPLLAAAIEAYRHGQGPPEFLPTGIAQVIIGLAAVGLNGLDADDLVKLQPPDRMDPALNITADRIADNIPLAIDHELVRRVGRDLLSTLYSGLGINGPEGIRICRELAQESPSVAGKREELLKRLERLETASRELVTVGL